MTDNVMLRDALHAALSARPAASGGSRAWRVVVAQSVRALADLDPPTLDGVAATAPLADMAVRLGEAVDAEIIDHLRVLDLALGHAERSPELLRDLPVFTNDPDSAEELQRLALDALMSREAIHRIARVAKAFGAPLVQRVDTADARLRAALPTWTALTGLRERLAPEEAAARDSAWWFSLALPTEVDPGDDEILELDDAPNPGVIAMAEWFRARAVPGEGRVRLRADEARALLSTERGRNLALYLGDRLDLRAAEPSEREIADALAPAPGRSRMFERLADWLGSLPADLVRGLEELASAKAPELVRHGAFAATGRWEPTQHGLSALTRFFAVATTLDRDVGVVSFGSLPVAGSLHGEPTAEEAVLVVPAGDVTAVRIGDATEWILRGEWDGGGLAWGLLRLGDSSPVMVTARRGDDDVRRGVFRRGIAATEPDIHTLLLREIAWGSPAGATRLLGEITSRLDADDREAYSGIVAALDAVAPNDD